ncbi:acetylornithine aminotransferase [Mycoemilia scoparia]|uniref:acetylornithine transaminase n=1 Tax=Mycoemilia scoparia TaxID=417184 RepID=A0A9W8DX10_9FUNG|nr:acetylornithine aminotransferase [Mycoemilia scoparia]
MHRLSRVLPTIKRSAVLGYSTAPKGFITSALKASVRSYSTSSPQAVDQSKAKEIDMDSEDIKLYKKYTLDTYGRPSVILDHGKGAQVFDNKGTRYIDFTAGIAVNAFGHGDEGVANVLADQSTKLVHISNLYYNPWSGRLAETLVKSTLAGFDGSDAKGLYSFSKDNEEAGPKIFFTNSGTEANEGALKFARKYGKVVATSGKMGSGVSESLKVDPNLKYGFVSFIGGFHGRSLGALSLTPNPKYQDPFTPLIPGVVYARFNKKSEVSAMIDERTCAVVVEPIQGEGGVHTADEDFLRALRRRCDQVKALLIYDEIQCGLGRTGKFWAHHHYPADCAPDVITFAKPLANGVPIGGITISQAVADIMKVGDHGTTFGGNPLACRVGHHVAERISKKEFLESVTESGKFMVEELETKLKPFIDSGLVSEIRGNGLLLGLQISKDPAPIVADALKKGLLLVAAGGNTIRIIPPLVITKAEISEGVSILANALKEVEGQQ